MSPIFYDSVLSRLASYQIILWGVHLDAKIYWISPESLLNSKTVTALLNIFLNKNFQNWTQWIVESLETLLSWCTEKPLAWYIMNFSKFGFIINIRKSVSEDKGSNFKVRSLLLRTGQGCIIFLCNQKLPNFSTKVPLIKA